ncbi:MAG: LysE family transporter [Candidatus Omnitrophica bacterium]|nr:LysE family transporter [Candidatus Omnitrophota bacterium]
MNYFSVFIISFTIALSGAMAPGPLLAAVISGSLKDGFKTGPLVILGHAVLELCVVALLVMGLGRFINTPGVIRAISAAGAIILVWFGTGILRSIPKASVYPAAAGSTKSSNIFLQGITMSLANPYWAVWWLTIGLGLLLSAGKGGLSYVIFFFAGHIFADLGWYSFVSFSVSKGRRFISPRFYRALLGICAAAVILFGVYFGVKALVSRPLFLSLQKYNYACYQRSRK